MPNSTRGPGDRDRNFAVAVRDGVDLYLVLHIRRSWKGEFVLMWRGRERPWDAPLWDPHATFHRDGELHHKSFGCEYGEQRLQKPDASFTGIQQFTQTPVVAGDGRALNVHWEPAKFDRIFEFPDQPLHTSLGNPSWISIDVTDAGTTPQPIPELGQRTIKQEILYEESVPYLWATLFELAPVKVETGAEAETRRAQEMELARLGSRHQKRENPR